MKLKNKKTGKIVDLIEIVRSEDVSNEYFLRLSDNEGRTFKVGFSSLAELNEEWEDAPEEPKEYWYIDCYGMVLRALYNGNEWDERRKLIGNYFETREETEKAVEKLKAFANLRKRGLKFNGWDEADRGMVGEFAIYCDALELDGIERELEIVFGREEL